jgi:hypothetical protein
LVGSGKGKRAIGAPVNLAQMLIDHADALEPAVAA